MTNNEKGAGEDYPVIASSNADTGGDNPRIIFNEDSPVIPEGSETTLIQWPVHYTRGQIWDYSSRKICNLPNNDGVEPKELGELLVTIINTYQRSIPPVPEAGPESGEKDYEQYYQTPPNDRDWAWYLRGLKEGYSQAEFEGHKRPVPWPQNKGESVSPPPQAESEFLEQNKIWLEILDKAAPDPNYIDGLLGQLHKNYSITRKP